MTRVFVGSNGLLDRTIEGRRPRTLRKKSLTDSFRNTERCVRRFGEPKIEIAENPTMLLL